MPEHFEYGTEVEISRDVANLDTGHRRKTFFAGDRYIVEDFFDPAVHLDDLDDPDEYHDVACYFLNDTEHCHVGTVPADAVSLSRTPEELQNRRLPTKTEIASDIINMGFSSDFDISEVDYHGVEEHGMIEAYGTTNEGLPFVVTLKIESIFHADY